VTTALAAGLVILCAIAGLASVSMSRLSGTAASVERTHRMLRTLEETYSQIADAETGSRGYALTGDTLYLDPYEAARGTIADQLRELRALTADNPRQRALFGALEVLVQRRFAAIRRTVDLRRTEGLAAAVANIRTGRGKALMDSIRVVIDRLESQEEALLADRSRRERASVRGVTLVIGLGLSVALAISLLATAVVRRELTARAADERALRAAKEDAEAASRAKTEFLARMSHELRTPLNSVIGFSSVLLRRHAAALGGDARTYLERIRANGMHLLVMIDDLLDIARIEVGRVTIERGPMALDGLVREVVGSLEDGARARGLWLRCELPGTLAPLDTDAARLRQVLVNLVSNAIKFTERGGVTVRVAADPLTRAPTRLEVADTGIGVPRERQAAVFEAFEQGDTSIGRRFGGTGLGLAISRALCGLLGYELTLASEPGVGSTFTVVLAGEALVGAAAPPADVRSGDERPVT
jgi:signal transduction histidine kinase